MPDSGIYDSPFQSGAQSGAPLSADDAPERLGGADIARFWRDVAADFKHSRDRIMACRRLQRGETLVALPGNFSDEAQDTLVVVSPQRKLLPIQQTNLLRKKRPRIKRLPVGQTLRAQDQAEQLSTWTNSVMDTYDEEEDIWGQCVGKGVQEGEYGTVVLPMPAAWDGSPSYLDAAGKPNTRYWRDLQGRAPGESGYGRRSSSKSKQSWEDERLDYLARRLPFEVRVISATDCVPVFGPRGRTEGLITRTLHTPQSLIRRRYIWPGRSGLMRPGSYDAELYNGGKATHSYVYLYEAFMLDEQARPYVSYCVGGQDTSYEGDYEATINLHERYGLSRLPARYCYGNYTADDDPDYKAVPLMDPIGPMILNRENLQTSRLIYARRSAFPPYAMPLLPNMDPTVLEQHIGRVLEIPSGGGIIEVLAKPEPLMALNPGADAIKLVEEFAIELQQASPSPEIAGGPGAASGRSAVVQRGYFEDANGMILLGARLARQFQAELIVEYATALAEGRWTDDNSKSYGKLNVPIFVNEELPPDQQQGGSRREVREFDAAWTGPVFDLQAEFTQESASLAEIQLAATLQLQGQNTLDDVLEKQGYSNLALTKAQIYYDAQMKTPEGQAELRALAAKYRGDDEGANRAQAIAQGDANTVGTPTDALPPGAAPPPGPQGPPPQGPPNAATGAPPSIAASSLGGQVAGDMQTAPIMGEQAATSGMGGGIPG